MNTFKFSWNLSSQLAKPFNENCQINGIGTVVIDKMEKVLVHFMKSDHQVA